MNPLIGRYAPKKRLNGYLKSRKSEFVVVYGRRRVGKTFLIRKTLGPQFNFHLTGLANADMSQQLAQFYAQILKYGRTINYEPSLPKDWFEAFRQLIGYLEKINKTEKKVIFLDELPWLDTQNSNFLTALEHFWNDWASAKEDIVLVVCGSAATWMIHKLINNKGGLHNRVTDRIKLAPFTLSETELFLNHKKAEYNRYQTMLIYMAFGGIPFYLDFIDSQKSAIQNINDLCFTRDAIFRSEYDNLYASLFKKHQRHISIIEALAVKLKGLTRREIVENTDFTDGGGLTRILNELEESNFIRSYSAYGKKNNDKLFQLIDLYSLFHLRFIKKSSLDEENFWINNFETPSFFGWSGYAYEMVCLHHIPQIKNALGISGVQTKISTWRTKEAQIDLVIDRKDQVINLCEMKFSINPFTIDKKYAANLRNKLGTFREETKSKKALFLTMISTYGVKQNQYSGMVRNNLTMDVLFEELKNKTY